MNNIEKDNKKKKALSTFVLTCAIMESLRMKINIVAELKGIRSEIYIKRALNEAVNRDININEETKKYVREELDKRTWHKDELDIDPASDERDTLKIRKVKLIPHEDEFDDSNDYIEEDDAFLCEKCKVGIVRFPKTQCPICRYEYKCGLESDAGVET